MLAPLGTPGSEPKFEITHGIIGTAPEAFDHPEHGLVGLHMMFRAL